MWPIIHGAEKRISKIVEKYPTIPNDSVLHRALNQLARENLLLQSSDWPFLITTWQARDYAVERFRKHQENFESLAAMIENNSVDQGYLESLESVDNPFATIDYRVYTEIKEGTLPQNEPGLAPLYS
jgi:1,4-alpha-glucan branching enzyme